MSMKNHPVHSRRGSVVVLVLWSIAVAAIMISSVQLFAYRQATLGREALDRIQARWAARAGLEQIMNVMAEHTMHPVSEDAKALYREMQYVAMGELAGASYDILHHQDGIDFIFPMDEHSKLNLNRNSDRGLLLVFDNMTLDVLEAIGDWIDADDDPSPLGVERDYYLNLELPYEPRNGPLRSIGEIELIAGIWPKHFRGEDWNLNNRLDPNEDDGGRSMPPDDPDGILDAGWSRHLTVYSVAGGATYSGQPRIRLLDASVEELQKRLDVTAAQAEALIQYGRNPQNQLSDLLVTPLVVASNANNAASQQGSGLSGRQVSQPGGQQVAPLTDDQLRAVLAETCIEDPLDRLPGKMNINTVPARFLRDLFVLLSIDEAIADEIIYMRASRPEGITSLVDLKSIPNIPTETLRAIGQRFDTISNVFTVTSRGRSFASGLEVEIIAVVDRSTVPVRIIEYREQ